jgi:hypothetical protein
MNIKNNSYFVVKIKTIFIFLYVLIFCTPIKSQNNVERIVVYKKFCRGGTTTRALWNAGVPNIYLFHPHILNAQLLIRQLGIYSSPYLYQIPKK